MKLVYPPGHDLFGLENLPYGVYSLPNGSPRIATRLGNQVVDIGLLLGESGADKVFGDVALNAFMKQGHARWVEVRGRLRDALVREVPADAVHDIAAVRLHMPFDVSDYVDFYASEHHATNLGKLFRPNDVSPLGANWKHLPVGYHGRAGSIVVSGTDIHRPQGQKKGAGDQTPHFGASERLDIEAELGFVVGTSNPMGAPISVENAAKHIFGVVLFNDWSARDIQAWEYVPLGPNLGKSFASTISPWVVPLLALDAALIDIPRQDPPVLPYLAHKKPWGLDIDVEVEWNGVVVSRPPYSAMYWSPAQMLAHMTVNGAPARTGDLFASGTISGPKREQRGAFIELTWGGAEPIAVNGVERTFLLDGDEVVLRASAPAPDGGRIGFGEARGRILPAPAPLHSP